MKEHGRVPAGRSDSAVTRSARASHEVIATAVRRLESRRARHDRAVYVAEVFCTKANDDHPAELRRLGRSRIGALSRHEPFSPLAGTLLRPFGDAAITIQTLLRSL